MTAERDLHDHSGTGPADALAEALQDPRRLPPLAELLDAYPSHLFGTRHQAERAVGGGQVDGDHRVTLGAERRRHVHVTVADNVDATSLTTTPTA